MTLCDGDCDAGRKLQELQQLVAYIESDGAVDLVLPSYRESWLRVLELLDIPTF